MRDTSPLPIEKLKTLRQWMIVHNLDALIVPTADEHLNEYLPPNRQRRQYLTNFTGSAGDCLVTQQDAYVFVDSRYYQQADQEIDASCFYTQKLGLTGALGLTAQLAAILKNPNTGTHNKTNAQYTIGIDPTTVSAKTALNLIETVTPLGAQLLPTETNGVDSIWSNQPESVFSEVIALPDQVAGQSAAEKISKLQDQLQVKYSAVLPIIKLDQIAWLFNLRGQDIPYNPIFSAYCIIMPDSATLFVDSSRFAPGVLSGLPGSVNVLPYQDYFKILGRLVSEENTAGKSIQLPVAQVCWQTYRTIQQTVQNLHPTMLSTPSTGQKVKVPDQQNNIKTALKPHEIPIAPVPVHPVDSLKMIKNPAEMNGMILANQKASRAKIRALCWLENEIGQNRPVSEKQFADYLENLYAEEAGFRGLSFNTIAATGGNGAIVHYGTPEDKNFLEKGHLFLIDSGCQFLGETFGGTTDDTRTVFIGAASQVTERQKHCYTAVLKSHIAAARQVFPEGTPGSALDAITRGPLWQNQLDFGHGTGHGVGAFLNVHEGPNGIHSRASTPLEVRMVTSIEPGFYAPNWGGIRLENLYRVINVDDNKPSSNQKVPSQKTGPEERAWLTVVSLTLIPFDPKLIDWKKLTEPELIWLKCYNSVILETLLPTLEEKEAQWLKDTCAVLG
ncbi:MAG: aminopeptidase P family protein [Cyanobacteria bacterium P01_H01_bin.74]